MSRFSKFILFFILAVFSCGCTQENPPVNIGNPTLTRYPTNGDQSNARPRSVWDMHYFNGRIYIGSGDYWNNTGPTDIWTFTGNNFVKEFTVDDEMIYDFFEYDNKLFIPGNDATEDWTFENLYINDPKRDPNPGWEKLRTLPGGLHSFCVAQFQNKLYANMTTDGSTPDRILVSDDMGQTWTTFLSEYGSFIVVNDFMFIDATRADGKRTCYRYDGVNLQIVTPNLYPYWPYRQVTDRCVQYGDGFLYAPVNRYSLVNTPLFFLPSEEIKNGGTAVKINQFAAKNVRDIVVRGTTCYVMTASEIQKDVTYRGKIYSSTDLNNWSLVADFTVPGVPLSFEVMNNKYYVGLGCMARRDLNSGFVYVGPESGSIWEITGN